MRFARTPALAATAAEDALLVQRCSCGSRGQAASGIGSVRVHRDAGAAASAREIAARAYTVGNHVVFGSGSYSPKSRGGRRLIAPITKDTNVDKLIKTAKKVLKTRQKKYDKETDHGCKPDRQGDWKMVIAAGLPDVALKAK